MINIYSVPDWVQVVKDAQSRGQVHYAEKGKYGVSGLSTCMQKTWFKILGKNTKSFKVETKLNKAMWIGTAAHDLIQRECIAAGYARAEVDIHYKEDEFEVHSPIDLLMTDGSVVDIKTNWKKYGEYDASSGIHQTNFYMGCIGAKFGGVLVFYLSNPFDSIEKSIDFIPIEFDLEMFNEDLGRYRRLTRCLASRTLPDESDYNRKNCGYCEYHSLCPVYYKQAKKIEEQQGNLVDFLAEVEEYDQKKKDACSTSYSLDGDVL